MKYYYSLFYIWNSVIILCIYRIYFLYSRHSLLTNQTSRIFVASLVNIGDHNSHYSDTKLSWLGWHYYHDRLSIDDGYFFALYEIWGKKWNARRLDIIAYNFYPLNFLVHHKRMTHINSTYLHNRYICFLFYLEKVILSPLR